MFSSMNPYLVSFLIKLLQRMKFQPRGMPRVKLKGKHSPFLARITHDFVDTAQRSVT